VLVIGDVMLDEYIWGTAGPLSSEAPGAVVRAHRSTLSPGGAANVAANIAALGGRATLLGVVGHDEAASELADVVRQAAVDVVHLVREEGRTTTRKVRVVAHRQQLARIDWEDVFPLSAAVRQQLLQVAVECMADCAVLVLSDYAKGSLSAGVAAELIGLARARQMPVIVDPKGPDFGAYRHATLLTPNEREAAAAIGAVVGEDRHPGDIAATLLAQACAQFVLITRGSKGMSLFGPDGCLIDLPARANDVADATGAGDTVVATLALSLSAGATPTEAAGLANLAAGLVSAKLGVAHVSADELRAALLGAELRPTSQPGGKHVAPTELPLLLRELKRSGRRIVFTNGCFDVLHPGHIRCLREARALGDVLIVGINTDASVERLKGTGRPLWPQSARIEMLTALADVDYVVTFDEDTAVSLVRQVKPDVYVKGDDYGPGAKPLPEADEVTRMGGTVRLIPLLGGYSTSELIRAVRRSPVGS
jgi:D-beta-D-heptose 7-phosphate kinase/D-beta-D-heptose 1-phosphate adenosyltransferase